MIVGCAAAEDRGHDALFHTHHSRSPASAAEDEREHIQHYGQGDAEQQAGDDREIERAPAAAHQDVSRQMPYEGQTSGQQDRNPQGDDDEAKDNE